MTMTTVLADPTPRPAELIKGGRYRIDGKTWTRSTNIAKAIADDFTLRAWGKRMVATGLAKRPDLLELVATADRGQLDGIVEQAEEAGGAYTGRDLGSKLHDIVERHLKGLPPTGEHDDILAAYVATMDAAGIEVVPGMVERVVTNTTLGENIAGRFDFLARVPGYDLPLVCDLKTGKTTMGAIEWAAQLSIYANAEHLYDEDTDTLHPMVDVDKTTAIIVHLPSTAVPAVCTLHTLDLVAGWEAAHLAVEVRSTRKAKVLVAMPATTITDGEVSASRHGSETPPSVPAAPVPVARRRPQEPGLDITSDEWSLSILEATRAQLAERVNTLADEQRHQLAARWPEGVATLKPDNLDQHTADTLAAITALVVDIGGTWCTPSPSLERLAGDSPEITATIARLQALPNTYQKGIAAAARREGVKGRLSTGLTRAELTVVLTHLESVERLHEHLRTRVANALAVLETEHGIPAQAVAGELDDGDSIDPVYEAELIRADPVPWDADRIDDLADCPVGLIIANADATGLIVDQPDTILATYTGGRRALLSHAKQLAKELDLTVPATSDAALADPLLTAALAVAEPPTTNPTKQENT